MPKAILAATDMSARGDVALHRAIKLARDHDARLMMLSVVDDAASHKITESLRNLTTEILRDFAAKHAGGVKHDVQVITGDPIEMVINAGDDADLLVLGTHRPRVFLDTLRETTAQRITRLCGTSVLIAKDADCAAYDAVFAGLDFSPCATSAIQQAAQIAPDAPITPIHALHIPYSGLRAGSSNSLAASFKLEAIQYDSEWRKEFELPDGFGDTVIEEGSLIEILDRFVKRAKAPLVAVGAHGRVGQGRAIMGSIPGDLMRNSAYDLLIARPPKRG